jgi:hypothetical protein
MRLHNSCCPINVIEVGFRIYNAVVMKRTEISIIKAIESAPCGGGREESHRYPASRKRPPLCWKTYIQGWPILPDTGLPFLRLFRLAG